MTSELTRNIGMYFTPPRIVPFSMIDTIIQPGSEIYLTVKPEKINVFTADGSRNILTGVRNDGEADDGA